MALVYTFGNIYFGAQLEEERGNDDDNSDNHHINADNDVAIDDNNVNVTDVVMLINIILGDSE